MPPGLAPNVSASAGAMTIANRSGVMTGMRSSRGVRTVSAMRRAASVRTALTRTVGCGTGSARVGSWTVVVTAVMGISVASWVGARSSRGERAAGELEVDVVERGSAAGHRAGREADVADGRDQVVGRAATDGDVDGGPDDERVVVGDAGPTQLGQRPVHGTVEAELDELGAQPGQQRGRSVEGDDASLGHDGDSVAELLGLVEVMGREQDGHPPRSESRDVFEELEADSGVEADGRLVEEQDLGP